MIKMRHLLACAAFAACAAGASAQAESGMTVVITGVDGVAAEIASADITSIKFADGNMQIAGPAARTWAMPQVQSIKFRGMTLGNAPSIADACALRLRVLGQTLRVDGFSDGMDAGCEIYTMAGAKACGDAGWRGEDIDISPLQPGVYLFRTNNTTLKFIKK